MVNTKKLRGRIIEKGFNYEKLAEALNISSVTFGKKMRNISPFNLFEVEVLIRLLDIPMLDFVDYFLMEMAV